MGKPIPNFVKNRDFPTAKLHPEPKGVAKSITAALSAIVSVQWKSAVRQLDLGLAFAAANQASRPFLFSNQSKPPTAVAGVCRISGQLSSPASSFDVPPEKEMGNDEGGQA
jgi:hypothetical protein